MVEERAFIGFEARTEHDDRGDRLDPLGVGQRDDGDFGDAGMREERLFYFAARDDDAAGVDDVLEAVDDVEIALRASRQPMSPEWNQPPANAWAVSSGFCQ